MGMLALKVDVGFLIEKIFPVSVLPLVNGLFTFEFQKQKMIFTLRSTFLLAFKSFCVLLCMGFFYFYYL
jgi:hypothetical protein